MIKNILFSLFAVAWFTACSSGDWRTASRESAKLAPPAAELETSIFQVYAARAFNWRAYFAIHPWVAWKQPGEAQYTTAQVVGWGLSRGVSAVAVAQDLPDRYWYGREPELLYEVRGAQADKIIEQVKQLIETYPYKDSYRIWPGPNSNTFVAHLIRNIPELEMELPAHAIGKDWLPNGQVLAKAPMGTGLQFSLFGVLGLTAGLNEGFEVNVLGLNFGFDIWTPALKLPFIGRLGFKDRPL